MTRKAVISAAELKRMAEVANSEGVTVEFERDGAIVRVMPFSHHRFKKCRGRDPQKRNSRGGWRTMK